MRHRSDLNQTEIVKALRKIGATVHVTSQVGDGFPDLVVGFRGQTLMLEVKDGSKPPSARRLTADEDAWIKAWRGGAVWVVSDVTQAIDAVTP